MRFFNELQEYLIPFVRIGSILLGAYAGYRFGRRIERERLELLEKAITKKASKED